MSDDGGARETETCGELESVGGVTETYDKMSCVSMTQLRPVKHDSQLCSAHLLLMRGGVRRHMGGGGGSLRGGDSLRGGGRTVGVSTAVTVIS